MAAMLVSTWARFVTSQVSRASSPELWPERPPPLEREEARSVEPGAGGPERLARGGVPGRAVETAQPRPQPRPVGHLELVADTERLQRLDHLSREEALVQPERDLADARRTEAADQRLDPLHGSRRRARAARPPEHAGAVARLGQE